MPISCPRCQTVNADGQAFCGTCGTPLAAAAPPAAAPVAAPPPAAQPATAAPTFPALAAFEASRGAGASPPQSPYATPPPPATPRRGSAVVLGGVGAAVAVALIVGILIATLHSGTSAAAPVGPVVKTTPSAAPTSPPATAAPSATAAPTAAPTPAAAPAGNVLDEKYLTVPIPDGYTVKEHTPTSAHLTSSEGDVYVDTGTIDATDPAASLPGLANQDLGYDQKYSSDAKICVPAAETHLGSQHIPSQTVTICGNWTPTQGAAFPFSDGYSQALSMYKGQPLVMRVEFFATTDKATAFFMSPGAVQIVNSTVFKLYAAT